MKKRNAFFFTCLSTLVMSSGLNAQWEHTNGCNGAYVNALSVNGTYLFAGTRDSGVFRSGDSGVSWLGVNTGLTNLNIQALVVRGTFLLAGTYGGGVFRSGDNGASWQAMNTGISTLNIQALGGNDSFLFAGTSGGGVCRSSDNGAHWLEVSNGLVHVNVFSIGVTGMYVFVGTWGGSAFRTADNGLNWFLVTNGLFDPRENIIPYCFATADTFLFTGTGGGGIFRAKDSARAWYPFNIGLPDTAFVTALALSKDTLFAATHNGVFRSINNGSDANWVPDNNGLADTVVSFAVSGSTLFAGTKGNGVWRRSLSAIPIPLPPVLSSPGNVTSGIAVNPALSWNTVAGASTYAVQVSTAADFSTQVVNQSGITATIYNVTNLLNNTPYYWRVNATNAGGTSAWSAAWQFMTVVTTPSVPVHASPVDAAANIALSPALSWNTVAGASTYAIQVSTAADFSTQVVNQSGITATIYNVTNLLNNTPYYWRVNATNAGGTSAWSAAWRFMTVVTTPSVPVHASPVDTAANIALSPALSWNTAAGAATYAVQVSTASDFSTQVVNQSGITATIYNVTNLLNNTIYYWRVNATNAGGTSAWATSWSFTTIIASPSIPVAVSPDSSALDVVVAPSLSWHAGQNASLYHVQLSTEASFVPLLLDSGNVQDTLISIVSLSNSTMYFWRVSSLNAANQSPWSSVRSFTTICGLPAPVVTFSYVNDTLKIDSLLCKWTTTNPRVTSYHLQVFSDSILSALVISDSTIPDTCFVIRSLHNNRTFWWRVRACNVAGCGPFSNVNRIIIRIPTTAVVPPSVMVASAGSSLKNGNLRYGIPKQCAVSLVVYDIQGRSIWNYVSSHQPPGYYNVNMNRSVKASGHYILQFVAGDYKRIVPFIIN